MVNESCSLSNDYGIERKNDGWELGLFPRSGLWKGYNHRVQPDAQWAEAESARLADECDGAGRWDHTEDGVAAVVYSAPGGGAVSGRMDVRQFSARRESVFDAVHWWRHVPGARGYGQQRP